MIFRKYKNDNISPRKKKREKRQDSGLLQKIFLFGGITTPSMYLEACESNFLFI